MSYRIHSGDTLGRIARRYGVSVADLLGANPRIQNRNHIVAGGRLEIPGQRDEFIPAPGAASSPTPTALPPASARASDWQARALRHPDDFFKSQFRTHKWNPDGPGRSTNCGPASLAMAVKAFGLEKPGLSAEQSIDVAREAMGKNSDHGPGVTSGQVRRAAQELGLQIETMHRPQPSTLDAQLDQGRMVVLSGHPGRGPEPTAYERALRYDYNGGHFILVMGRKPNGSYVVADPLSRRGTVELTPAQMQDFLSRSNKGTAVWR